MKNNSSILESVRATQQSAPCVSIFLKKHEARLSEKVASIALYQELLYARALLENTFPRQAAADYLKPILQVARDELINGRGGTLAIFHSGEVSTCLRLPGDPPELTVVSDSFHVKPLLSHQQAAQEIGNGSPTKLGTVTAAASGTAVTDLFRIARALKSGKVKQLWIADDLTLWGRVNRQLASVVLHPRQLDDRDADVLDDLCEWALDEGADVRGLPLHQIPGHHPAFAITEEATPQRKEKLQ